jgi:hypothetical protein
MLLISGVATRWASAACGIEHAVLAVQIIGDRSVDCQTGTLSVGAVVCARQ